MESQVKHICRHFPGSAFPAEYSPPKPRSPELPDKISWVIGGERLLIVGFEDGNMLPLVIFKKVGTTSPIIGEMWFGPIQEP